MNPDTFTTTEDLIARFKRGDPEALTELLSRYRHRLYRFLLRLLQDPAAAEDLFQETWLRVMEKIDSYDGLARFDTWLFTVGHNLAVDYLRHRRSPSLDVPDDSGATAADRLVSGEIDPLGQCLDAERGKILAAAICGLPAIHREVLALRFEEGMKLEEIADIAGIPLSTVKSRLSRALENLRGVLQSRFLRREDV